MRNQGFGVASGSGRLSGGGVVRRAVCRVWPRLVAAGRFKSPPGNFWLLVGQRSEYAWLAGDRYDFSWFNPAPEALRCYWRCEEGGEGGA